jgi:hypothetical protein
VRVQDTIARLLRLPAVSVSHDDFWNHLIRP